MKDAIRCSAFGYKNESIFTFVVELFPCASVLSPSPSPSASLDPFTENDKNVKLRRCG